MGSSESSEGLNSVREIGSPNSQVAKSVEKFSARNLLSAIVEIEHLTAKDLSPNELEEQLQKIWRRSFAYYASFEQERLENLFIKRGRALKTEIYSNYSQRRRLYRTSLPPRAGNELLTIYPRLKEQLQKGENYIIWRSRSRHSE